MKVIGTQLAFTCPLLHFFVLFLFLFLLGSAESSRGRGWKGLLGMLPHATFTVREQRHLVHTHIQRDSIRLDHSVPPPISSNPHILLLVVTVRGYTASRITFLLFFLLLFVLFVLFVLLVLLLLIIIILLVISFRIRFLSRKDLSLTILKLTHQVHQSPCTQQHSQVCQKVTECAHSDLP